MLASLLFGGLAAQAQTSFVTIGDFGGNALETHSWIQDTVAEVAKAMADQAAASKAQFVINTGDNFYWCGIQNTSDYQIQKDFVEPYLQYKSLNIPWYSALGNHEYGYNVEAQIDLQDILDVWVMPDRYYKQRVKLGRAGNRDVYATFVVVDTSPCVSSYRSESNNRWDPCGSEYPTCSIHNGADNFEGPCKFHENILTQNCTTQLKWLEGALATVPETDWLIAVGHHIGDEMDVEDLIIPFQKHGFDLYLNGHAHKLTHYSLDGDAIYVTSGAGSLVETPSQQHPLMLERDLGEVRYNGHSYKTIYNKAMPGFTKHTFENNFQTLRTDFYDWKGSLVHTFSVKLSDRQERLNKRKATKRATS